ncbi:c-type cytochrome domain-containing protein [Yeosuana sp. MJ-SS3]|uniref:C-type cytochrome domain-containing protein n=1 Tax=Gilvirhabdus luticola TaxID=3079858 RepID=A0ABU3U6J3_9FLAO|nr:c-type cytochrome domain-containing protein [Yeosuana sp. MJ-SS3]MDU8886025.1 c-type cytochrome domain-containing protein [Yeosuana sp. MJ-SS3]
MNNILKKYGVTILLLFALLIIIVAKIGNLDKTPKVVLVLGRFHLLLLHLPIGALLITFFLDIIGRIKKDYPSQIIKYALGFTVFFAIITCILGYFLSLQGGYGERILNIHFWTAMVTALLASALFILSLMTSRKAKRMVLPFFIITFISISVTGHYGSILTHGENFLTEYVSISEKLETVEVVDSLKLYENVIARILDDKCIQCHNATKTKGKLSLISKETILKGGESGEAIIIGNAEESLLYNQLLLPESDKKHMPPKGKPQLTTDEKLLIKHWIDGGADFEGYIGNLSKNDTLKNILKKYLVFDKTPIKKASVYDIDQIKGAGFMVKEMGVGAPELSIKYNQKEIEKSAVKKLSNLKDQIVELDLSNTNLSDNMTSTLRKLENLKMLRLDNTKISDKTLQYITNLEHLETLNLFNTSITDNGLETLLKSVKPKHIYCWKSNVGKETSLRLQKTYNIEIHNGINNDFVEETKLKLPTITPNNTFFTDSITLNFTSNLKNAELRYTLNGEIPDSTSVLYSEGIKITENTNLKVKAFKKGWLPSDVLERDFFKIKHQVTNYIIKNKPDPRYPNANKLFDLEEGSTAFRDGKWTGYLGYDVDTTIDLGSEKVVNNISINCLENVGNWILFPTKMIVYASLNKEAEFEKVGELILNENPKNNTESSIKRFTLNINNTEAQFFKIIIKNLGVLPTWHEGAGNASWVFVDEIFLW